MERPRTPGKENLGITYQQSTAETIAFGEHMGKQNDKAQRRDHFTSEFHRFSGDTPGTLKDFTGALVLQPRNPNHRPDFYLWFGRTELVWRDVLRAQDAEGESVRISVPEEEVVCTGDVLVDAVSIKNLDIPAFTSFLWELQRRQVREEEEWERKQKERKRERRRRHQKRKRARKKAERQARQAQAEPTQGPVASRRSDEDSTKDEPTREAVQDPHPRPRA